jgi:hypothetical protein
MQSKFTRISRSILLGLLTGIFPLVALWKNNLGQIPASVILSPFLFTLLFILITNGIWLLLSRSFEKAAFLSALFNLFVFSFGHVFNLVGQMIIFGISIGFIKLLVFYLIVLVVLVVLIFRLKHFSSTVFMSANIAIGFFILFNLIPIASFYIQTRQAEIKAAKTPISVSADPKRPDVYLIILDSYARDDILHSVVGYNNSAFIASLKERGFFIPQCAFSNYDETLSAMTSVLNFQYLDTLGIPLADVKDYLAKNVNLILDNQIAKTFRGYGYKFVTGRGFSSFNDILTSDIYLNYRKNVGAPDDLAQQNFINLYLKTTLFRVLTELSKNNPEKFIWLPYWLMGNSDTNVTLKGASFWYNQNNYMIDSLEKLPEKSGPFFVYAHINAPHGPYVYRADGTFRYPLDTQDEKVLYADMVTYLNKRVLELVDVLLEKSALPPIIIIQGDHSIHGLTAGLDKHKILNAYFLPGVISTQPYDTITPVNDFRLVLKDYFDPSVKLLPDTLWVKFTNTYQAIPSGCDLQP